ncbi:RagB/SusD family nutrient uptake outer membrane protein [uncultured Alistipes sp.]|uniref:RagB/SusD family nutrient uptake outer membrane protein n=1 Tax=uncultured Alistipes sp. TaxID=538949 RepID=UPI00320975A3
MKIKNIYRLGSLALLGTALSACTFLDTDPQIIPSDSYYTSETKLQYGLAGVYGVLSSEALYGNYYSLQISNADDLCYFNNYNSTDTRPDRYNHAAGTAVIYETWLKLYQGIKNANEYIQGVEASEIDPEELSTGKETYLAEARFLRAYYHFLLAQAWGDVPLRVVSTTSPNPEDVQLAATPQEDVLKWCVDEMEAIVDDLSTDVNLNPSRVTQEVAEGILARIYLFMAGESVADVEGLSKQEMYKKAADWAYKVIAERGYVLNPSYEQVFINMIQDKYDTEYHESMWEAEFLGDRTSADKWTNGRIGDLIGLKSQSGVTNYSEWACNYSYGFYNGSYTLWQLYSETDRVETDLSAADDEYNIKDQMVIDKRRIWNLPGYNFRGFNNQTITYTKNSERITAYIKQDQSMYRTPWTYNNNFAMRTVEGLDQTIENAFDTADMVYDPDVMGAVRNAGKWRRETIYENQMSAKSLYTTINFPILRYSDILLMYAEAINEYAGAPDEIAWNAVLAVRERAGIQTDKSQYSDQRSFRNLVRNERGRELVFEGLRKYDLIRWGIFVERMHLAGTNIPTDSKYKNPTITNFAATTYANVSERHIYLPIPTKELAVNHALTQNPLW